MSLSETLVEVTATSVAYNSGHAGIVAPSKDAGDARSCNDVFSASSSGKKIEAFGLTVVAEAILALWHLFCSGEYADIVTFAI